MKRGAIVFLLLILSVSFVVADDVAYIYRRNVDPVVLNVFNEMSLEVDLIKDTHIITTDFSDYDFIFVGNERLRNARYLPTDSPIVIASGYNWYEFGLTDRDGISQLASNARLKVKKDSSKIEVYNQATFKFGGISIPYYYIPYKHKNENMQTIATTAVGYGKEKGDVISYSSGGPKKCFFGVIETKFWTQAARDLFKDCVEFVRGIRKVHDVEIDANYSSSVNGIRIKNVETGEYLLNESSVLDCTKEYTIEFKTINIGYYTEDVTFDGVIGGFTWNPTHKTNLAPGDDTTRSKTINEDEFSEIGNGTFNLEISATLDLAEDDYPENNFRSRTINVICGEEPEGIHDVGFEENYDGFGNFIRIKDPNNTIIDDPVVIDQGEWDIQFRVINKGDYNETGIINCSISDEGIIDVWQSGFELVPEEKKIIGNKNNYDFTEFTTGSYEVICEIVISEDDNPSDNIGLRNLEVI